MYLFGSVINVVLEFSYFEFLVVEVYTFVVTVVEFLQLKNFFVDVGLCTYDVSLVNGISVVCLLFDLVICGELYNYSILSCYSCVSSSLVQFVCNKCYFLCYSFTYVVMFKVFMSIKSIFSVFFNVSNYLESLFLLFVQFYLVNFIDSVSFCSLNINFLVVNVIDFLLAGILLLDMTI